MGSGCAGGIGNEGVAEGLAGSRRALPDGVPSKSLFHFA